MTVPTKTAAAMETMRSLTPPPGDPSPSVDGDLGSGDVSSRASRPSDEARVEPPSTLSTPSSGAEPGAAAARRRTPSSPAEVTRPSHHGQSLPRAGGASSSPCLSDDEILQYRQGQASTQQLQRIDAHLDRCLPCQQLVDVVIRDEFELNASPSQITTFHQGFVIANRYRIERFVGRGGMGEVYSALDDLTGKRVALKTVLCTATDDPRAIRKLFGEVLNAQRISHPNVFKIYDLHEHFDDNRGRVPFFTMEYIEGESLGLRLRHKGALPIAEARPIAEQLLAGLAAAHAKGVLHLDFKSDNVLLREGPLGPEAVIMDFGLSRMAGGESMQQTSERLQGAGTLPYMSIEQLECRSDVGAAADVYAFGVVLYEMLTGQLPFRADSMSALLLKQLTDRPVPPTRLVPQLSADLETIMLRCLSRQAAGRYDNAAQALAALQSIGHWERSPARGRSLRAWAPFGVALLLAIGAGVRWRAATAPERETMRQPHEGVAALEPAPPRASPTRARTPAPAMAASTSSRPSPFASDSPTPTRAPEPASAAPASRRVLAPPPEEPARTPAPAPPRAEAPQQPGPPSANSTARDRPFRIATPKLEPALDARAGAPREPPSLPAQPSASGEVPEAELPTSGGWRGPPPRAIPKPLPL